MLDINGVGLVKFEKYGQEFLNLCIDIKEEFKEKIETRAPLKKLTKTYLNTYELIQEGMSLNDIAMKRDLGLTSILSHLTVLSEHEKISAFKKEQLLKPLEIPSEIEKWIKKGLEYESMQELKQHLYLYEFLKKM